MNWNRQDAILVYCEETEPVFISSKALNNKSNKVYGMKNDKIKYKKTERKRITDKCEEKNVLVTSVRHTIKHVQTFLSKRP